MKMLTAALFVLSTSAFAADFMTGSYECVSKKTGEITRTVKVASTVIAGVRLPVVEYKRNLINVKGLGTVSKVGNDRGVPSTVITLPIGNTSHGIYFNEDGSLDHGDQESCLKI